MANQNYNYNYMDGNTVRKLQPAYEPQIERPAKRKVDEERQKQIRKNRARYNVIDYKFAMLILFASVMIFTSCISYVKVQARISAQKIAISELQNQYEQVNNENVAKEEMLNSSVDLNDIYKKASTNLKMKYADSKHTIIYESTDPDYVKQYQDIPKDK